MIIWGIICIVGAFGAIGMGALGAALFWAALGSVLIAIGIQRNRQKQQQAQQQTVIVNNYTIAPTADAQTVTSVARNGQQQAAAPGMVVRTTSGTARGRVFPVAGVTFDNDDGSSRQEILRGLCEGSLEGSADCWLEPYLYEGKMALRVKVGSDCVGNIRKNDVQSAIDCINNSQIGAHLEAELFETDDGRELYRADVIFDDLSHALPES